MTRVNVKKDLFVLVADLDMEQVMKALCQRHRDLGTRQFGVVMFDHSGCGSQENRATIQRKTEALA